jgi:hypothetical protein
LYVVEEAVLMVTFWPPEVDIVKLGADTLLTVPTAPPAAGPDRAFDPWPPDLGPPLRSAPGPAGAEEDVAVTGEDVAVAGEEVAVAGGDVAQPAESPITAHISAAPNLRENMETTSSVRGKHTEPREVRCGSPKRKLSNSYERRHGSRRVSGPGASGARAAPVEDDVQQAGEAGFQFAPAQRYYRTRFSYNHLTSFTRLYEHLVSSTVRNNRTNER